MTIHTVPLHGPGTLTIGTGPGITASAQVRSFAIEPTEEVTRTDAKKVLSGEELPASESASYTYAAKATFLQDDTTGGIVDYTWDNAGGEKAFTFKPNDDRAAQIVGTLRVIPIRFGGDVDDPSPESEVTFAVVGAPTFTPVP